VGGWVSGNNSAEVTELANKSKYMNSWMNGEDIVTDRPFGLTITMFIYTTDTINKALTNTKNYSLNFKNYSVEINLFLYILFFGLGPDAARTQYITHTVPTSSTCTLSWNTRPMLRRSTTCPVACEHKNLSRVNTRICRYPPAVSPWHGSLAIRWTPVVSP
jgi:hypothetical protein